VDDQVFFEGDPWQADARYVMIPDDVDGDHALVFELSGKTADHTHLAADGSISQDLTVSIADVAMDGISLGHVCVVNSTYEHDFNGTGPATAEKFYGTMGCNGRVTMKFTTPVYIWLLENM
jgi:hypothetical protein